MLWTGWMGFEAGTGLHADGVASMALLTTHSAGAFGALTWTAIEWLLHHGRPSILGFCAGAVAGLAAITPAAGYVGVGGSAIIGIVGSAVCYFMAVNVKGWTGWDETLDAFGVHATGGMTGTILVGLLASPVMDGAGGIPEVETAEEFSIGRQVGKQIVATLFVVAYTAIVSWLVLLLLDWRWGLRVSDRVEAKGLDLAEMDDGAYLFAVNHWEGRAFVTDAATSAARMVEEALAKSGRQGFLDTISESGDSPVLQGKRGQSGEMEATGWDGLGAGWGLDRDSSNGLSGASAPREGKVAGRSSSPFYGLGAGIDDGRSMEASQALLSSPSDLGDIHGDATTRSQREPHTPPTEIIGALVSRPHHARGSMALTAELSVARKPAAGTIQQVPPARPGSGY